jgi:hypothetical protein
MNFMDKLERKWGRYAIPELHKYLVFAYFLGYLANMISPVMVSYMQFNMSLILRGQIWRLVTWIFSCNSTGIMTLLFLFCLLSMGKSLEYVLGTFRMNVLLIGGMILNLIVGILLYLIPLFTLGYGIPTQLSNYYTLISMYMALAICMPEAEVHLYFLIPIKMKWMLAVYLLSMGLELWTYYSYGGGGVAGVFLMLIYGTQIICALINMFFFYQMTKKRLTRKQKQRQKHFQAQMKPQPRPGAAATRHKCVICGKTEKDDPDLSFRYCSKCTGNKEYCQDHLFTHTHQ